MAIKKQGEQLLPGYLAVSRRFFEHQFWDEHRTFSKAEAWIDLLQGARWRDDPGEFFTGGKTVVFYRGEQVASLRHLCQRWRWPMTTVHRFLDLLERENMIARRISFKQTVITLVNYEAYNGGAPNPRGNSLHKKGQKNGTVIGTPNGTVNGTPNIPNNEHITDVTGTPNGTVIGTLNGTIVETSRNNMEEELERKKEEIQDSATAQSVDPGEEKFKTFVLWVGKYAPTVGQMKEPFTRDQYDRIREKYPKEMVTDVILAMHNTVDLLKKYRSANLTCQNWCKRRLNNPVLGKGKPPAHTTGTAIHAARDAEAAKQKQTA